MRPEEITAEYGRLSVLVVGDICLDRWCVYDPGQRQESAETGIPRLAVVRSEVTPGAGGTVANNLVAMGVGRVAVLGVCGRDGHGYELSEALKARGIEEKLLIHSPLVPTFTYTKVLNAETGEEDQPRLDFICGTELPGELEAEVCARLTAVVSEFDVVIVADQAETRAGGVVTGAVRALLGQLAARHREKVVWVDSRERLELFRGVVVKPNESEAAAACRRLGLDGDLTRLRAYLEAPVLLVTRGPGGVEVVTEKGGEVVPTRAVAQPVDICGAGDSFSAAGAITLAVTGDAATAARFGNAAASVTIMKKGTGTASAGEMLERLAGG